MGGIYKYDVADLGETARGLRTLKGDFAGASSARRSASGALGYPELRSAVAEFVDNWEHNRTRQLEAIDSAAAALDSIVQNYVEGDRQGAQALRSGGRP